MKLNSTVLNIDVVKEIEQVKTDPDTNYGHRMMTFHLMQQGYYINHKKVYRLMKEAGLLASKLRVSVNKNYVKYRQVCPDRPLEVIEMDIKMVWVTEHRRHAYILTIIDTFTRHVLHWTVGYQMKQNQVKNAWLKVIEDYLQPYDLLKRDLHIELRNDNGPQFCAKSVREFLKNNHIQQVFTHPYTPQENGHVESFHAILSRSLGKNPFWSLQELEVRLEQFYYKYNEVRHHGSTAKLAPSVFWKCWEYGWIERQELGKFKIRFKLKVPYQQLSIRLAEKEDINSNKLSLKASVVHH